MSKKISSITAEPFLSLFTALFCKCFQVKGVTEEAVGQLDHQEFLGNQDKKVKACEGGCCIL